jgi:hypothetical protein
MRPPEGTRAAKRAERCYCPDLSDGIKHAPTGKILPDSRGITAIPASFKIVSSRDTNEQGTGIVGNLSVNLSRKARIHALPHCRLYLSRNYRSAQGGILAQDKTGLLLACMSVQRRKGLSRITLLIRAYSCPRIHHITLPSGTLPGQKE